MKPSLQFRLSQHLALTPQLQQSIRLLQLSTLELHQEVEQMLEQNPFLEAEEEFTPLEQQPLPERVSERGDSPDSSDADSGSEAAEPAMDSVEFGATEREDWENGTERDDFDGIRETPSGKSAGDDDDSDPLERTEIAGSLQDHLREQLRGMRLSATDAAAVEVLIDSLNEDGYLDGTLEDIAQRLAPGLEEADLDAWDDLLSQLRCGLKWLQSLEPTGVGAADLSDCLILQLRTQPRSEAQVIAILICKQHLELLARRDIKKLMAATGADEDLLREAQAHQY